MKVTLKSVLVLALIALFSVTILVLANAFFPKYVPKLDMDTVKIINKLAPSGVDDTTALNDKYFGIVDLKAKKIDLDAFNKENKAGGKEILAVYQALKGNSKDSYIVESQADGYVGKIVTVTAYSKDGKIMKVTVKSHSESYWDKINANIETYLDKLIGKSGNLAPSDLASSTGATYSITGIANSVTIANSLVAKLGA